MSSQEIINVEIETHLNDEVLEYELINAEFETHLNDHEFIKYLEDEKLINAINSIIVDDELLKNKTTYIDFINAINSIIVSEKDKISLQNININKIIRIALVLARNHDISITAYTDSTTDYYIEKTINILLNLINNDDTKKLIKEYNSVYGKPIPKDLEGIINSYVNINKTQPLKISQSQSLVPPVHGGSKKKKIGRNRKPSN